jgi:hypothetical protein
MSEQMRTNSESAKIKKELRLKMLDLSGGPQNSWKVAIGGL